MLSEGYSVKACLDLGVRVFQLPRLEVQMLMAHVLGRPRVWLIAHDDHVLSEQQFEQFHQLGQRRTAGEPMAYLVGEREFMGLAFEVSPAVLIPRPETELLVQSALEAIDGVAAPQVLDLGTGSGAIAVAIAHARPDARVWATDISADAIDLAQRNAARHGVKVEFVRGSWFDALAKAELSFDVIASNPPYIAAGDLHLKQGDLRFEPIGALTDGHDGLSVYRLLASNSGQFLRLDGHLCVEHGFDQGTAVAGLLRDAGFLQIKTIKDMAGHPRVTTASYNG